MSINPNELKEVIPEMTANNAPVPFVSSASSLYANGGGWTFQIWKAFIKNCSASNSWHSADAAVPQWLCIDLGMKVRAIRFSLTPREGYPNQMPKGFRLEGSNDGTNWNQLTDDISNITWIDKAYTYFDVKYIGNYRYYRVYITTSNGGYTVIGNFQLYALANNTKYIVQTNNTIKYYNGTQWETTPHTIDTITAENYELYSTDKNYLSKTFLSDLGDVIDIIKVSPFDDDLMLCLRVMPHDQIVIPIASMNLSLAKKIKKVTPCDIGSIYRLFSIDDGVTWETFIDGERTTVLFSDDNEQNIEMIKECGLSTAGLSSVTEEMWETVFSNDNLNKRIMFLMLIPSDNKTINIGILQDRYGYYQDMIHGTDYDLQYHISKLLVKCKRAIPTEIRITHSRCTVVQETQINENNGDSNTSNDNEWYSSGADVTPHFTAATARVKSSSIWYQWVDYKVFDDADSIGWVHNSTDEAPWISVDMMDAVRVVKMSFTNHDNGSGIGNMVDFVIEGSFDDISWITILAVANNTSLSKGDTHEWIFPSLSVNRYRFYRVCIKKRQGGNYSGFKLWKLYT